MCGKAWSARPSIPAASADAPSDGELTAPVDLLLQCMLKMFRAPKGAEPLRGLVVASSDVLLLVPPGFSVAWPQTGATGLAIPADAATGANHGVYHVEHAGGGGCPPVKKFFQKAGVEDMRLAGAVRGDGSVLIDSGVIYFSPPATATLLTLARTHPLDSCTYQGLDCSNKPLRIELYSDIMMAMGCDDEGGAGSGSGSGSESPAPTRLGLTRRKYFEVDSSEGDKELLKKAREVMWAKLTGTPFFAAVVEGGDFAHVGTTREYLQLLTAPTLRQWEHGLVARAAWYAEGSGGGGGGGGAAAAAPGGWAAAGGGGLIGDRAPKPSGGGGGGGGPACVAVQNTLFAHPGVVGAGSVVEHSHLSGAWRIGAGCLVSSVRTLPYLTVRSGVALQEVRVPRVGGRAVTLLATNDPIKEPFTSKRARVCGAAWDALWRTLALSPGEGKAAVWGAGERDEACTLWNARLWPVFALGGGGGGGAGGAEPPAVGCAIPDSSARLGRLLQVLVARLDG